jgi:hypothetical protein
MRKWAAALSIAATLGSSVTDAEAQRRGEQRTHDIRQPAGLNRVFYDMAGQIPGFAGFWFDSTATVVVSLTDPAAHGAEAVDAVRRYLEQAGRGRPSIRLGPAVDYNFRQLHDWMATFFVSPPSVGLTAAGVCTQVNRVCVAIEPGRSIAKAYEKADLLGVPRAALLVRHEAPIKLSGKRDST